MMNKNILFFGYSQLGYDALKKLIDDGYNVCGVVTHQNASGEHIWFDSVLDLATSNNIPVFTPSSQELKDLRNIFSSLNPSVILSVYYRYMIPVDILNIPQMGGYNVHGSLLPLYRGRAPLNWAILKGEKITGITLHEMVEKPDAGAIIDQSLCEIDLHETAGDIMSKFRPLIRDMLEKNIPLILSGSVTKTPMDLNKGTYFSGRKKEDGKIDPLTMNALEIHNLVRALQPYPQYPGAYIEEGDKSIIIHRTQLGLIPPTTELIPTEFINVLSNNNTLWIHCKDDSWLKVDDFTDFYSSIHQ